MSRVWATARVLAALAGTILGLYGLGYLLGRWARWSGYSPDEQARMADERRRRALGEPDHFDVLPEPDIERAVRESFAAGVALYWLHMPESGPWHVTRKGQPCGSCGAEEPAP